MTNQNESERLNDDSPSVTADNKDATDSQDAQQQEYRRAYLEQLRRMHCPTCGEGEPVF